MNPLIEERLALGEAAARQLGLPHGIVDPGAEDGEITAAFLGGSLAEGLGHRHSDVDVYLVGRTTSDAPSRRQLFGEGVRFDVQHVGADRLADLVGRIAEIGARSGESDSELPDSDLDLAVRFRSSRTAFGEEALAPLRSALASLEPTMRRLSAHKWTLSAHTSFEDAYGLSFSTDPIDREAARSCAQSVLLYAGKALAAVCGELHFGEKWVRSQLARSAPVGFPSARYRKLLDRTADDAGEPDPAHVSALRLAQSMLIYVSTIGWRGENPQWPAGLDGGAGPQRSGEYLPRVAGDKVALVGPNGRVFSMRPEAVLVWGLRGDQETASGAGTAELPVDSAPFGLPSLSPQRHAALIEKLRAAELLTDADAWEWAR